VQLIENLGAQKVVLQHYDGTTNAVQTVTQSTVGAWFNITAVFVGLSERHLYINGDLVASNTTTVVAPSGIDRINVGFAPWSSTEVLDGVVDQPAIWNRALSASEVATYVENPWQLFAPRSIYIPAAAAAGGVPTLSASTYVTGSLTSTGWRPQVTAS
jgi:hypothetical protein